MPCLDKEFLEVNLQETYLHGRNYFFGRRKPRRRLYSRGLGVSIYTQGDTMEALRSAVVDAVRCHYEDGKKRIIRLHIVREEVIAA